MKNTKENRKAIIRKQLAEFGVTCYLICTCHIDNADELFELPVTNYRLIARELCEKFKKEHTKKFCLCTVCHSDGSKGSCFSI